MEGGRVQEGGREGGGGGGQRGEVTFEGIKTLRSSSEMGVTALGVTALGGTAVGGTTP
jgi:hypothetical protein